VAGGGGRGRGSHGAFLEPHVPIVRMLIPISENSLDIYCPDTPLRQSDVQALSSPVSRGSKVF
jgi:hypothetical protein